MLIEITCNVVIDFCFFVFFLLSFYLMRFLAVKLVDVAILELEQ